MALLIAVVLGVLAYRSTSNSAFLRWEQGHAPSSEAWKSTFTPLGYETLLPGSPWNKAWRNLKQAPKKNGETWVTEDLLWIMTLSKPLGGTSPELVVLKHKTAGNPSPGTLPSWLRMEQGWSGFEEALKKIQAAGIPSRVTNAPIKKRSPKNVPEDPRQLLY